MTERSPATERNLDGYGAPPIPWERVRDAVGGEITQAPGTGGPDRHTTWLATIQPDGRPHVVPVGVFFDGGTLYFTSGRRTRKGRNLARDSRCTVTVATHPFDLVFEGRAAPVTDADELARVRDTAAAGGWEATVEDGALTAQYSAPSAGPPPWHVYRLVPDTVFAFGTAEPYGAARFDF